MKRDPFVRDTVILLSGGLDSAVLAHVFEKTLGLAVFARYGQRHCARELGAARAIAMKLEVGLVEIDLTGIYDAVASSPSDASSLLIRTDATVPSRALNGAATVVPNRNMVFIAAAAAIASAHRFRKIAYGATATDRAVYPDCRPPFVRSMQEALQVATEPGLELIAPFERLEKADVVRVGVEQSPRVPFELTWSCYQGGEVHCGVCGACAARQRSFAIAGVADPTSYRRSAGECAHNQGIKVTVRGRVCLICDGVLV